MTLREKQTQRLQAMLTLNEPSKDLTAAAAAAPVVWKVLVMDQRSQSIVSSVLRVNDLLKCGVTLHCLISQKRSKLDTPSVYFILPTEENINALVSDIQNDTYESYYVNFVSAIDRPLLEHFAKSVSLLGKAGRIKQAWDQYLNYTVTDPQLFLLGQLGVFQLIKQPTTAESEIYAKVDEIADGIVNVVLTLDDIPIIRCQRGGAAELVGSRVDLKLRELALFKQSVAARLVLIICDRDIDLTSMFHHSWIYECMISDVFQLKRNTIKLPAQKVYDIDPHDFFWSQNSHLPFPDVVENANIALEGYKREAAELTAATGTKSLQEINAAANAAAKSDSEASDTADISAAVAKLPELTHKKTTLDMHMDILSQLLGQLEKRQLDKFFEVEQNSDATEFANLLSSDADDFDKLRTFVILYLLGNVSEDLLSKVKSTLSNTEGLQYIERFKSLTRFKILQPEQTAENKFLGLLKLYGSGLNTLTKGLKNILPLNKKLPLTNIVQSILDPDSGNVELTDDYLFLDPKVRGGHLQPPRRQTYGGGVVFVVGGGSYLEYQNLRDLGVVYGSTEILTAEEFWAECCALGTTSP